MGRRMRRFTVGFFLAALVALSRMACAQSPSSDAKWSGSTMCMYAILLESHAMAAHCGVPLDAESEARYRRLLAAIRQNILNNTEAGKQKILGTQLDGYEASVTEHHRNDDARMCHSKGYAQTRSMLEKFSSSETSSLILKHFKGLKQNPYQGDCL
jgi:hypothetical protein